MRGQWCYQRVLSEGVNGLSEGVESLAVAEDEELTVAEDLLRSVHLGGYYFIDSGGGVFRFADDYACSMVALTADDKSMVGNILRYLVGSHSVGKEGAMVGDSEVSP